MSADDHDPGVDAAKARAMAVPVAEATPVQLGDATVLVGTAGWTDPSLTAGGVFYPPGTDSAEDRLRYYACRFPVVEVDSPYYALPSRRAVELWAERTPATFTFDIKANALMTGQPSEVNRLPKALRTALPKALADKQRIYGKDLPPELYDAVWDWFTDALEPLHAAGKLGAVLLQYPRWFQPTRANVAELLEAKRRLGPYAGAIEFRNRRWLDERRAQRMLEWLAEHDLPLVVVDAPQGMESGMPRLAAAPSPRLAVVRMHGRRADTWERPNVSVAERYRYLYDEAELESWVPDILALAREARRVHVIQNNCYANYGTTNALELTRLLLDARGIRTS